jgi:hypothetical protein
MTNNTEHDLKRSEQAKVGVRQIIWSMADTTWRMFVAPAILVPAGLWADLKWGTKPWLTILGAVAGLTLSVLLVRAQLRGGQ